MHTRSLVLLVSFALAAGCAAPPPATMTLRDSKEIGVTRPDSAETPPAARGAYLATIAGCAGCHTPWSDLGKDESRLYGGSPGKDGKPGTPNISPDPETGIGRWTDRQIVDAIREGKRPDGSKLTGRMPCPAYHDLTDEDGLALAAFLRSVKPVANKIERVTPGPDGPQLLDLPPATGNADPADDPLRHGVYLVKLMRCKGCHTPREGPFAGQGYAGGNAFGKAPDGSDLYASNITSDPETGIGTWSAKDIGASVRELVRPDGTKIRGPMNWHKDEWAQLTDADAAAMAAFLKSLPPVKHKVGPKT